MRKSASIILLFILFFNMVGYRAWFYYAEKQSDAALEARLDKVQYDENDLVTLTIPLNNPYQLEHKNFVRVDGEISFQGKTFKYVKQMVSEGNLILLCIPDSHKMVLKKAKSEFGNLANDLAGNSKGSSRSGSLKNFNGSDYTTHAFNFQISDFSDSYITYKDFSLVPLPDTYIASPGKPPQYMA